MRRYKRIKFGHYEGCAARKGGENWSIKDHVGSGELPLRATTGPVPLDEIYAALEL